MENTCHWIQNLLVSFVGLLYCLQAFLYRAGTKSHGALAALSSAFNPSSSSLPQSNYKSNNVNHDGPTQRASALAALSSAFNPTSSTKTSAPKPLGPRQGSQRAAAVAALSSVLTAERKKGDSDTSAARSSRSPSPGPRAAVTGTIS
ncbi:hypothetical protein B296_00012479 [Ensete ventricosum]|uniref:Uncharacterized protein n=1 Tax=Ensete ventricosum TaxID=4639 RepID=A0A427B7Y5_ENSVE|nr:hypothetical protein B296_00012479 [Ensete ventricosum]